MARPYAVCRRVAALPPRLLELLHKLLVELDNAASPFGAGREERRPEMQSALLLPEAGARNDADTCRVQHAEAVELVGGAAFLLGLLDGLFWQVDGGEEIHGDLECVLAWPTAAVQPVLT